MINKRKTLNDLPKEVHELQIACGLAGIYMNYQTSETILEVQKGMKKHGNKFAISHAIEIKLRVEELYHPSKKKKNEK